ncbi:MAG: hypothetical protein F2667_00275 [Actinobacteria bacterium]|nr:hypothetical protein [Actinomycetota bacterium]
MSTTPRLVTAETLCQAVEATLRADLPGVVAAFGWTERLGAIEDWHQVPRLEAISTANLPAGAITSPGLVRPPTYSRSSGWSATWRVVAGVYVRGEDHHDTAARCRDWAGVIRTVFLANRSLGGVADGGLVWAGEEYDEQPQKSVARTLAACAVAIDVSATNVIDTAALDEHRPVESFNHTITPLES